MIILIDEYDVPLDKAFQNGFYREMVSLIRGLFGMALKTNDRFFMILQIYALNGFGFLGGILFHKVSHVSLTHSSLSLISFKIPMEMLVHNRPYFLSVS